MTISIVAHRGDSGSSPENTIPSFRRAVQLQVDYVELDYQLTADSKMVVIHDTVLDRTTDAVGRAGFGPGTRVRERTWEELRRLNAADWPSRRWSAFRPTHIPLLQEALDEIVCKGGRQCVIERKPGAAAAGPLCDLIEEMHIQDRVVITSWAAEPDAWNFLDECLARLPGTRVAYQLAGNWFRDLGATRPGQIIDCEHSLLTGELVARLKEHGLQVFAWTVNTLEEVRRLAELEIDGITTDCPAEVLLELRQGGRQSARSM